MIGTLNIKPQQLLHGTYKTGSGPEHVLVMGSCRSIPYLNYFHELNTENRFTIHYLDPFNWNWDLSDQRVDYNMAITLMENHPEMLATLKNVKWFIHEHYQNFGMFNTNKEKPKHIYQFGLNPELDICIPNFHDVFILFQDFITFDDKLKAQAAEDMQMLGVLSASLQLTVLTRASENINKFIKLCADTSFPDMAVLFHETWRRTRYFWTFNHVSSHYTTTIMRWMNARFLNLNIPNSSWDNWIKNDMFHNVVTPVTKYDLVNHGVLWDDPVVPLKI